MGATYRIRQGLNALGALLRPVDDALAADVLAPDLYALYRRLRRSERQHSLRLLRDLKAQGHTQPELLAAALLHDVGKTRGRFSMQEKVLVVLVRAGAPGLAQRWGHEDARWWQRPFAVSVQHPAWGADMAAQAGAPPLVVELIRRHADPVPDPPVTEADRLLTWLQAVDDRN